jgi:hypothetical protein
MCIKCVRHAKRFPARSKTFGQIKALAHSFKKYSIVGLSREHTVNIGVEAHLYRIEQALTKRRYKRRYKRTKSHEDWI